MYSFPVKCRKKRVIRILRKRLGESPLEGRSPASAAGREEGRAVSEAARPPEPRQPVRVKMKST